MALDLDKLGEKIRAALKNMTPEEAAEFFPPDTRPKGWLSIEEHLPFCMAQDLFKGGTTYKVKYADGTEGESSVMDHNIWYYEAKDAEVTHWWND